LKLGLWLGTLFPLRMIFLRGDILSMLVFGHGSVSSWLALTGASNIDCHLTSCNDQGHQVGSLVVFGGFLSFLRWILYAIWVEDTFCFLSAVIKSLDMSCFYCFCVFFVCNSYWRIELLVEDKYYDVC
jgi:hypothetical protein